ncbi:hypothetical protein [Mesoterricola silvestris]|uniref:Uncharacterized protein n=1 Tax=Mesoterricola silvestris TaxID=2927979 RepID=A0AA48KA59_9BACT|nr:hypothetical protein [Mesoterricola silvestris]BDU74271.1 hypothetical protein METEAL_34450 [Mesoterricola silvestris]
MPYPKTRRDFVPGKVLVVVEEGKAAVTYVRKTWNPNSEHSI